MATVAEVRDLGIAALVDLEPLLDKRCKLTFVMRAPHHADADMVVTTDDVGEVIAAMRRLYTEAEPMTQQGAGEDG